ncbi:Cyc3p [Saccharomyces cerevisiae FostersO]|nr:Cyc3p [Saccharomyces cerevisiae FostersO]
MDSTASSATSPLPPILPFLTIALYICCGEGYSQNSLLSGLLGMLEMVRSTGKSIFWPGCLDAANSGILFSGFILSLSPCITGHSEDGGDDDDDSCMTGHPDMDDTAAPPISLPVVFLICPKPTHFL